MAEEEKMFFFGFGNRMQVGRGGKARNGSYVEWTHDDCRLEDWSPWSYHRTGESAKLAAKTQQLATSVGHIYCLWNMRLKSFLELDCSGGGGGGSGGLLLASALTALA